VSCASPITHEQLVEYWTNDLPADETERIEAHLFGCEWCTRAAERVSQLVQAFRGALPPVIGTEGVVGIASTFASTPPRIALALPTATPSSRRVDAGVSWRNAPGLDLVSIEHASEHLLWEVTASARWLAGKTSYAPIDPGAIPGWRWARRPPPASWITWLWTDEPTQLPFDYFDPPAGVTFSRVAEPLR